MKIGKLSTVIGISANMLRRLVSAGAIPARRVPVGRANWRFREETFHEILRVLADSGLIAEADVPTLLKQLHQAEMDAASPSAATQPSRRRSMARAKTSSR